MEKIMKDQDVKKATKIKIAETVIFPAVTYGSESWTVRKKERKKTDAFELWMWRRIIRVLWTEKRTNLSVLEEVKRKRSLEATILRLKLRYFGHVTRAKRSLERDIMLGQVAGYRQLRSIWAKDWLLKRNNLSHINLLEELKLEPSDWYNYLCMDSEAYLELLQKVMLHIRKCDSVKRGADKSLARPTSLCILFDGENIDASCYIQ